MVLWSFSYTVRRSTIVGRLPASVAHRRSFTAVVLYNNSERTFRTRHTNAWSFPQSVVRRRGAFLARHTAVRLFAIVRPLFVRRSPHITRVASVFRHPCATGRRRCQWFMVVRRRSRGVVHHPSPVTHCHPLPVASVVGRHRY